MSDERRGLPPPLLRADLDPLLKRAFDEDGRAHDAQFARLPLVAGTWLDLTSSVGVPGERRARASLRAKARGVLAGLDVAERALELCDPDVRVERKAADGDRVGPGDVVLVAEGDARALLFAERTLLNFVQRLSGVATLTAACVDACAGRVRVLDTRKTTPGLRLLEKHAVRCGGGENHRFGLWDEVMIKNNHVDLAAASLSGLVAQLRRAVGAQVRLTAEARDLEEALAGVAGGADVILLDNFRPASLLEIVPRLRGAARERGRPIELEASGGITLEDLPAMAATGIDRVSLGALTHSAPALDFSLGLEPLARPARDARGGV